MIAPFPRICRDALSLRLSRPPRLNRATDRRDKRLGLFDNPFRIFGTDGIAAVISDVAKMLHLVEGAPKLRGHALRLNDVLAKKTNQPAMRLDLVVNDARRERKQGEMRGVEHGVIGAVASTIVIPRLHSMRALTSARSALSIYFEVAFALVIAAIRRAGYCGSRPGC
jgi:hypothetical protein